MKNILKNWTKLENSLLFGSIIIVSLIGIIYKSDLLTISCSIVGIITALLLAKGKNLGQVFGVLITILYSIVSFKNKFYGEVFIYIFLMLPMYIVGIISWMKHQNKVTNSVEINKIANREWIIIFIATVIIFIAVYFLLKIFNTSEILVSTFSVIASIFAVYLQIRRSRFSFYFYVINDLILIILWGIPVVKGNFLLLPMLFNPIINLINDSYGIINWRNLEKIQKNMEV